MHIPDGFFYAGEVIVVLVVVLALIAVVEACRASRGEPRK